MFSIDYTDQVLPFVGLSVGRFSLGCPAQAREKSTKKLSLSRSLHEMLGCPGLSATLPVSPNVHR